MSRSKFYSAMVIVLTMALMSISSLSSASAAPGVRNYGPFAGTSEDSGTCGTSPWATDTFNRFFKVFTEGTNGTYTVTEDFRQGSFVTLQAPSPAACETVNNGHTVNEGIIGKFSGTFNITVKGTFNPAAEIKDLDGGGIGTADFILSVFGDQATYVVTDFSFQYSTKNYGSWINASSGNSGDIFSN